jgi:transcriptional regulator with XRE-family HTH domain
VVFDTVDDTVHAGGMTAPMADFSDRLKEARIRVRARTGQKMTQQALASLVGVERNTVSRWENSGVHPKDPAVIGKLADALAVSTDWLVRGAHSRDPAPTVYPAAVAPGIPVAERRLPVRAYEQIDGYLARLESAGCSPAQTREADRVLRDGAYNRLRANDPGTRGIDEMLDDIASAWRFIVAVLGREGIALE